MGNQSNQKIYIDLVQYPLRCLGPGTRVGVWFQGCDIGCSGCISTYTWEQTKEKLTTVNELVLDLKSFPVKRLTISGGEPFMQPASLYHMLKNIRKDFDDIMIYSGYKYEYLSKEFLHILDLIDVLIDGSFKKELPTKKVYKGSKNQKMYIFNQDLIDTYSDYILETKKTLQLHQAKEEVYVLGIPEIKDAEDIKKILSEV